MSKLIGIGGKLTSGKDTVADFLVEKHGWMKLNMSGPLHEAAMALDPWIHVTRDDNNELWQENDVYLSREFYSYRELTDILGYTKAKEIGDYRFLLQKLGTEVGQNIIGENVWVDIASKNINRLRTHGDNVVITGIRFQNEFDMIKNSRGMDEDQAPGTLVWVDRPNLDTESTHSSESLTSDGFDITLSNDGTIDDLYQKINDTLIS